MNKTVIVALVIILIGAAGFVFWQKNQGNTMMEPAKTPSTQTEQAMPSEPTGMETQDKMMEAREYTVTIKNFAFTPDEIRIKKGETVTWTNEDVVAHTATAVDGTFDSKDIKQGESFSYTFNTEGTFEYLCTPHPVMKHGKVIVE